jgi:hypothetical protein
MQDLLEKFLPTTLMKTLAMAILSLSLSVPFLGEGLQKVGLSIELLTKTEIRLILFLVVVCIGLMLLYALLVIHSYNDLTLKYGIYWDKNKNSHCPSCKTPVIYGEYYVGGTGYKCIPCKKVYPLADNLGNKLTPDQALSLL